MDPPTHDRTTLGAALAHGVGLCGRAHESSRGPTAPGSGNSVCKWRERFRVRRLPGLTDEPRPGAPRNATDNRIVAVITRTLEGPPAHATQWTTRGLADVAGLSKATIGRIWQTFGLQSHGLDTFKLSADPQFVEKVRDIVGLYFCSARPRHRVVDGRKKPSPGPGPDATALADAPGHAGPADARLHSPRHDLAVCSPGRRHRQSNRAVSSPSSASGVSEIPRARGCAVPARSRRPRDHGQLRHAQSTEGHPLVCAPPPLPPAFHTDKCELAQSSGTLLLDHHDPTDSPRDLRSVPALEAAIHEYLAHYNEQCTPFVWTATADVILDKVSRFCERTSGTRH